MAKETRRQQWACLGLYLVAGGVWVAGYRVPAVGVIALAQLVLAWPARRKG